VLARAREEGEACVQIFFIRGGKLIGREYFILEGTDETSDSEVLGQFIKQFYKEAANVPNQVMLPEEIEEARIITQWLRSRRGGEKFELLVPRDGQSHELVEMAAENATETLSALRTQWQADTHKQEQALSEIQQALQLAQPPNRIECYDISNTQGTAIVGSMVVFEQGVPSKNLYRRFNVKSVAGIPDDFASMEEVLARRFKRFEAARSMASEPGRKLDPAFAILPDLVIVDGGKGQLSRATGVLEAVGLANSVPVIGLAKQEEELFLPHRSRPIRLPRHSQGLYLVQRIRDEAHRFAITAHRKKRSKLGLASQLDAIPGIGPARRKALLKQFGSIDKIKAAEVEELASVSGMTRSAAESIKAGLE
jgi:excinuclease ABC subunit C